MKYFAISDVHGFYKQAKKAVAAAGFDETNDNHKLIVLGDMFDRGADSSYVYGWLKTLMDNDKAIVLKGNHDEFFIEFLEGRNLSTAFFNYQYNGLDKTIADFYDRTAPFESWCLIDANCDATLENFAKWCEISRNELNTDFPDLLPWLKSLPNYFETKNYIFTHGSIDGKCDDWKKPTEGWNNCHWDDGSFYHMSISNTEKTVVVGHFGTAHLRDMYKLSDDFTRNYDILKSSDGRKIFIDGTVADILNGQMNVLEVEDELS